MAFVPKYVGICCICDFRAKSYDDLCRHLQAYVDDLNGQRVHGENNLSLTEFLEEEAAASDIIREDYAILASLMIGPEGLPKNKEEDLLKLNKLLLEDLDNADPV